MDIDELSRVIGGLETAVKALNRTVEANGQRIELLNTTLTNHRLKMVGLASLISSGIAVIYHFFLQGTKH